MTLRPHLERGQRLERRHRVQKLAELVERESTFMEHDLSSWILEVF